MCYIIRDTKKRRENEETRRPEDSRMMKTVEAQLKAAKNLRDRLEKIRTEMPELKNAAKGEPSVTRVYNPLTYAWEAFEEYVTRYGAGAKRVLFLGMNPGPWGMAQTGVPFGEVSVVRDWLRIAAPVGRPADEHPKYPVDGLACRRSEVSGKRLWGLFKRRFGTPGAFFEEHFVINYCPLLFIASVTTAGGKTGARNLTPDKLSARTRAAVYEICDAHLRELLSVLRPAYLVGIGNFAENRAKEILRNPGNPEGSKNPWGTDIETAKILHPSPASPRSNAGWEDEAEKLMRAQGIWTC